VKNSFLLSLSFLIATPVYADKVLVASSAPSSYETECASCHMAYPPGLLGTKNWQNIMSGLGKHFGTDASLDAKTQTEISNWLIKNAGTKQQFSALAPDNRITKSTWFVREHDELRAEVWKRLGVKSPSNCMACHQDASSGGFKERNIKVPAK